MIYLQNNQRFQFFQVGRENCPYRNYWVPALVYEQLACELTTDIVCNILRKVYSTHGMSNYKRIICVNFRRINSFA